MKKTKSYTYLYPMISESLKFRPQIENVYLGDVDHPEYDGNILILYKFSGSKEFLRYEESLKTNPLFVDSYDPSTRHVMVVMKVPEVSKLNYIRFKNSEYSKLSDSYKRNLLNFHRVGENHPLYHILYKTEEAFKSLEKDIGQPVPRYQEAGTLIDTKLEYFDKSMLPRKGIEPNLNFDKESKPKPFKFNTKGA